MPDRYDYMANLAAAIARKAAYLAGPTVLSNEAREHELRVLTMDVTELDTLVEEALVSVMQARAARTRAAQGAPCS